MTSPVSKRTKVFISYSHKDRKFLERFQTQLKPLEREGVVDRWDDTRIEVGERWKEQIEMALATAKIAVLLVSADFLASDFIAKDELPPILKAAEEDGLVIVAVIVGPCRFRQTKTISQFQALNSPEKSLRQMSPEQRDEVWVQLTDFIQWKLSSPSPPSTTIVEADDVISQRPPTSIDKPPDIASEQQEKLQVQRPEDSLKDAASQSAPPVGQKPELLSAQTPRAKSPSPDLVTLTHEFLRIIEERFGTIPDRKPFFTGHDALKVTKLVVTVDGIQNQYRYSTVQAVVSQFFAYCGQRFTPSIGAFHSAVSPELGAYLFAPPLAFAKHFSGLGFAEVFWADITERATDTKTAMKASKAWAETIVDRVRILDQSSTGRSDLIDYEKASSVVKEMIGTIKVLEDLLSIAKKVGLFEFNLGHLLRDSFEEVQIVAEFKTIGDDIFRRFAETMEKLLQRMPNVQEVYIIAHGEGTVVSFNGILTALSAIRGPDNEWLDKVKGYMTIGSPLNQHIVIWPHLWKGLKPDHSRTRTDPILWRNYYDFGDPVGFDLEITRGWMEENGWLSKGETKE
jgi:hypothetical protein